VFFQGPSTVYIKSHIPREANTAIRRAKKGTADVGRCLVIFMLVTAIILAVAMVTVYLAIVCRPHQELEMARITNTSMLQVRMKGLIHRTGCTEQELEQSSTLRKVKNVACKIQMCTLSRSVESSGGLTFVCRICDTNS
jgi:hypothetical protein